MPLFHPFVGLLALLMVLAVPRGGVGQQVTTYHDADGNYHQQQTNLLKPAGYRMIALSIYGDLNSPSYAAVWVRRPGPDQQAFHGLTGPAYQTWSNTRWALGYRPTILTAMGSGANPRFAGVYELQTNPVGSTFHGFTEAQYEGARASAQLQGHDVVAVDRYGTVADPRFIVAFGPIDAGSNEYRSNSHSDYQEHASALAEGHFRPALVAFDDHGRYVSTWRSDHVTDWVAHHDLTEPQFQNLSNVYWAQGRYPLSVQGSGNGNGRRFAAVWASSDLPQTPVFTMTGQPVASLGAFDAWVQTWMGTTGTRAAQLAIVKDAKLVFARGYTLAPPGYPTTQPTSLFEIASCSKPITSIAVHQHFERPQYAVSTTDPMVNHMPAVNPLDNRIGQVTLGHLLTHQGGWDRDVEFDPMFYDVTVAAALSSSLPIDVWDIWNYMTGWELLDFTPGTSWAYSNFGFSVLGRVLEIHNPGMSYERIVDRDVFTPLGLSRPRLARSLRSGLWPGEVTRHPHTPEIYRSVLDDNRDWVPIQYGAANYENMDSHGGWVMAAPDFAKILAAFDIGGSNPLMRPDTTAAMWTVEPGFATVTQGWRMKNVSDGNGGTVRMHHHGGRLAGSVSFIAHREDGLSFVFFTNGDRSNLFGQVHGEIMSNMANQVTAWPNHDLFYSVGIPPFVHYPGSVASIGQPCPGSNGIPAFSTSSPPDVGDRHLFGLTNGAPNSLAALLLGLQQTNVSLAPFGAPLCRIYADPVATLFNPTGVTGSSRLYWSTPPSPAAIGLPVALQAAVFDPGANPLGLTTTRGLLVTLGGWQ